VNHGDQRDGRSEHPVVKTYRDLVVWQKAMRFSRTVYRLSQRLPREQQFVLSAQLMRAALSLAANIAEGHGRASKRDYAHFVAIARGSLMETETFLLFAGDVELFPEADVQSTLEQSGEIARMLSALHRRLSQPTARNGR
jgi:four helix bundle protein